MPELVIDEQFADRYLVPECRNYYHFLTESALGLYRHLKNTGRLESRECKVCYQGGFAPIIQIFSKHPVSQDFDLPVSSTQIMREPLRELKDYRVLLEFRDYLMQRLRPDRSALGVTVIRRRGKRVYREHLALCAALNEFRLPVREVFLETLSFRDQVRLMTSTALLIGPHGAGHTNMMFMPPGSKVIELNPAGFVQRIFSYMAYTFGHDYAEVESGTAGPFGENPSPRVVKYIETNGLPSRMQCCLWRPDSSEMARVLRDVKSFSIPVETVMTAARRLMNNLPSLLDIQM